MASPEQYDALRHRAALIDRRETRPRGLLMLTGNDRRTYLQGLLTNDIAALTPGSGCYAALLTPQGRMITDMRVLELGDSLMLDLPGHVAAGVRDRLEQFVITEDVAVADVTTALAPLGVYGPQSAIVVAAAFSRSHDANEPAPDAPLLASMAPFANGKWSFAGVPIVVARNDDYGVSGLDLYVPADIAPRFIAALQTAGAAAVGKDALEVLRIEAGVPEFGVDMDEETIPLEAGIEGRAISLTKGCYVGQEIIIRVLHRGHGRVARRLVGFSLGPGAAVPARGAVVRSEDRQIGTITSAVMSPALGRPVALGYVHRDSAEPGTRVRIVDGDAMLPATVAALPLNPPAIG